MQAFYSLTFYLFILFFIDECSHLNRGLVKRPGAVCARVMYNYFYCKKCIRKFNMAINNLKIGCFDVKVGGCVGTGHHTVIVAPFILERRINLGLWETAHLPLP